MAHLSGCIQGVHALSSASRSADPAYRHPVARRSPGAPFSCLRASSLAARFHRWEGASGTRHTTSIFPVDHAADDKGLPAFECFVLVCVKRRGDVLVPLDVVAVEADRARATASGLALGASEWHVHFLAEDAPRRRAVADDLLSRHRPEMTAALSA